VRVITNISYNFRIYLLKSNQHASKVMIKNQILLGRGSGENHQRTQHDSLHV